MSLSSRRIYAIAKKEIFHIQRDPFTLIMALILPVIIVFLFGFAIEFNLSNISTAFVDYDKKPTSRDLIESFSSSNYFKATLVPSSAEAMAMLEAEKVKAVVIIPVDFEKNVRSGRPAEVQVLMDAADNSSVSSITGYLTEVRRRAMQKILSAPFPKDIYATRYLYNGELKSSWFVVPGLLVVVMAVLSVLLTSLTVAREWERGSMELLLSTPVHPLEIILGKLIPYAILGLSSVVMVYVLARTVFGVPFVGNHLAFILGCLLFLMTCLTQGILISVVTKKQILAMQMAMIMGLLPSTLLSGFIFPIESMPGFFRGLTMILPARWFMNISRSSFLQNFSASYLWTSFLVLTVICSVLIFVGSKKLRKDLE